MINIKKLFKTVLYPVIVIAIIMIIWIITAYAAGSEFIFPSPSSTFCALLYLIKSTDYWISYIGTVYRAIISYAISLALAIILASLSVFIDPVKKILSPFISFLRSMPTVSVILLFVLWAGPKATPGLVSLLVVFPILYTLFYDGMNSVGKDIIHMARLDGAGNVLLVFKFYLPLTIGNNTESLAGTISTNLKLIIAAEVLAGTIRSIGTIMQVSKNYFETATLIAITFCTVITAMILEKVAVILLNKIFTY